MNETFHTNALQKREEEDGIADTGMLQEEHLYSWAIIMDKGYQGAAENCCAVTTFKKPPQHKLSYSDYKYNKKIASDRIIVKHYFGRMGNLWAVVSNKWRSSENSYNMVFKLCLAVTNCHIR